VHVGTSAIYRRLDALPRIRWASAAVVETDQDARIRMLAAGSLPADTVVLSTPGPEATGAPAVVRVGEDGLNAITASVAARGAGYLVVADADQTGWVATVDGRPAELVAADQGVVAVAVPAGTHEIRLRFAPADQGPALMASAGTAVILLGILGVGPLLRRRRRSDDLHHSPPNPTAR
jgi:hypothetical protein